MHRCRHPRLVTRGLFPTSPEQARRACWVGVGPLGSPLRGPDARRRRAVGRGGAPPPAGSARSGSSPASEPPVSSWRGWQGHVPGLGFGADGVQLLSADRCLAGGLAADAQGATDLCPRGSFGAGGVDHRSCREVEGLSGVSQGLEVLHGPLGAALDGVERPSGPTSPPPGGGACLGAHDNASCHRIGGYREGARKPVFTHRNSTGIGANWLLARNSVEGVLGASAGPVLLISSYISRQRLPHGLLTTEKNDPRDAATSGGPITSQG